MKGKRLYPVLLAGGTALALAHLACSNSTATSNRTLVGSDVVIGQGTAHIEAVVSNAGATQSLSVVLSENALQGLPMPATGAGPEFVIPLPTGLSGNVFDHATLNWMPNGHAPIGTYDKPHFDVHWYLLTIAERTAMVPTDPQFAAKAVVRPGAEFEPPNYAADAFAIPRMGTHWTDRTSPEHHGGAFTRTFIWGFFDGKLAFIEPMMTVAFLQSNPDVEMQIAQPARYQRSGSYPTKWAIRHDVTRREHRVELLGFVER
ncbi:MAG: DUF5602 domain-containing protein, partial [Gemmatimonadaceae bacterium]